MSDDGPTALGELLGVLPGAGLRAEAQLRSTVDGTGRATPTVQRAVRDTLAAEILAVYFRSRLGDASPGDLVEETLDYLIGLSGTRVGAHDLTHGVVVTDPLHHSPRLELRYSEDDLRPAQGAILAIVDDTAAVDGATVLDRAGRPWWC